MKVIDLLNKIAKGEEVPEKIKVDNIIYIYENWEHFYYTDDEIREDLLVRGKDYSTNDFLNWNVELLEDELDKDNINLDKVIKVFEDIEMCLKRLSVKISSAGQGSIDNYLDRYNYDLQAVKQLNKEIKSIKEK